MWLLTMLSFPSKSSCRVIEPKTLFMYLCSPLGQALIQGIVSGASIPLIQLRALLDLKIIVPTLKDAQQIIKSFDRQVELQEQIERLKSEQHKLRLAHWGV